MKPASKILFAAIMASLLSYSAADAGVIRGEHFTLDELYVVTLGMEKKNPELVSIEQFGRSVQGLPLFAIKIARRDGVERPEVLITASIHAVEFTGDRVAIGIAHKLIDEDGKNPWVTELLDKMDFYILPLMNPDGYRAASRHLGHGFTMRRTNTREVDLNRNFPYPEGVKPKSFLAGSHHKISANYMGPYPLSEPETRALDNFVKKHNFFVAVNFHTTGSFFVYPWGFAGDEAPHKELYEKMGKTFNKHQQFHKYTVQQSFKWYQTVGDLDDWLYGRYGALSVTVEVAKPGWRLLNPIRLINPFWWYNPLKIDKWVENDRDATLRAIQKAYELTGGQPLPPRDFEWKMPETTQ